MSIVANPITANILQAAGIGDQPGPGPGPAPFATTLYTGTGAPQNIVSGLDFVTNDGLVWIKNRADITNHALYDTIRGATQTLRSDTEAIESTNPGFLTAFNVDGFSVGSDNPVNGLADGIVAWQWLVQEGFFDIQLYVGNDPTPQTIGHNLNHEVGALLVKNRDSAFPWRWWHRGFTGVQNLVLNGNGSVITDTFQWDSTVPTTTDFTVGDSFSTNENGSNQIAYLWAHNPTKGIFCGSYTGTGAAGNKQTTGFPVGWVMIKRTNVAGNWAMIDNVRDIPPNPIGDLLTANTSDAELTVPPPFGMNFLTDGFDFPIDDGLSLNVSGDTYIFIAIADPAQFGGFSQGFSQGFFAGA